MKLSRNIVDTQMTHAVGVAIIAVLVMKHGGSVRRFAQATDDLKLFVVARREGQRLIQALGHQVIPKDEILLVGLPIFLQVLASRILLTSRMGEVGLEYHISQAPDEMHQLCLELRQLVEQSGQSFPAIQKALA